MFESHVTVQGLNDGEFEALCRRLKVKPVIIENDTGSSGLRQMMTAKFHFTHDKDHAMEEMNAIAANFGNVLRRKLEYIVKQGKDPLPEHKYLEFHTKYELGDADVPTFEEIVRSLGGHTSQNVLKVPTCPGRQYRFATARSREVWRSILNGLASYNRLNTIMECVVHDDAPDIDSGWAPCLECGIKEMPESEFQYMVKQGSL